MQLSDRVRNVLGYAMIINLAVALVFAVVAFGATTIDLVAVVYALAMLLALLWATKLVLARSVSWKRSPMHWPVVAFTLYALIRYFTSTFEYPARLELFQVMLCAFIYFAAANNFYHKRDRMILLNVLVILAILESGYALWQFYTHAEKVLHIVRPEIYQNRGSGTFICPNHLAGFLGIVLGLVLAYIAIRRGRGRSVERSTLLKVYLIYAAVVFMGGMLATLSRAGWISTMIGVMVVLLWGDWRQRAMWPRIAVAVVAVVTLIVVAARVEKVREYITYTFSPQRAQPHSSLRDTSLGGRTLLWKATASVIGDHPVVGTGPGSWQWYNLKYRDPSLQRRPVYAHNEFLNLTSDYGLIGLLLGLGVIGCFYWQAGLLTKAQTPSDQRAFAVGSLIATTVILFHCWFDFDLHILANALLLATLMGCTAAMDDPKKRFGRAQMKPATRYGTCRSAGGARAAGRLAGESGGTGLSLRAGGQAGQPAARPSGSHWILPTSSGGGPEIPGAVFAVGEHLFAGKLLATGSGTRRRAH